MAVTKTKFINYTRCKRFVSLEDINYSDLKNDITYEEYKEEEKQEQIKEMFDEVDFESLEKLPSQLEAMMDYYNEVEYQAGKVVNKIFKGKSKFSRSTYNQKCFNALINDIKYLCYVDIYNEQEECINIIEVKATTSNKYTSMFYGKRGDIKFPLFIKTGDIYKVSPCVSLDLSIKKNYDEKVNKLLDRFSDVGRYIYDLSVQRYILEHDNPNLKVNYFLAVLNSDYVYDGYMENGKRVYNEINGENLISIFELNDITKKYQDIIDKERITLENNIKNKVDKCPVGNYCFLNKNIECPYKSICFKDVPNENASFNYLNFRTFKDKEDNSYDKYDLINNGYLKFNDVPKDFLINENHLIQRDCYDNNKVYVDKEKIKAFLGDLKYPIYHLDFETFPCPIPRFFGEKPYSQSCFEFSLHIEKEPGICDIEKDNYIYLAKTSFDEREELVKSLVEHIKPNGTLLAQNVSFEKSRIEELANIFPKYKDELLRINNMGYDLLYIIKNNEEISKKLGFYDTCKRINYYNPKQSGSYSIKKTLPLFTDLKYSNLDIQNGTEALVAYSMYDKMSYSEKEKIRENLKIYCRQDTWAMVEILRGLRNLVK